MVHRSRRRHQFGIGLGTLVLAANVVLLGSYTFGCHSLRHLVGGSRDEISKSSDLFGELRLHERAQPPAHAVCVDEPVLGRIVRPVRPSLFHGHLARRATL